MSIQDRFTEEEIAEIFEEATRAQNEAKERKGALEGLSLKELQQIGASTGIDPKYIAQAAAALRSRPQQFPVRKFMGIPIGVSRSVTLPSTFSDQDWEHLVVDLRKTFKARGKIKTQGSIREWANGNLHAYVEPTREGYELRLVTKKGSMQGMLMAGGAYIFTALFMLMSMIADSDVGMSYAFLISGLFMIAGFGMVSSVVTGQPKWARTREQQMEAICKRAVALGSNSDEDVALEHASENFLTLDDDAELHHELDPLMKQKKTSRA